MPEEIVVEPISSHIGASIRLFGATGSKKLQVVGFERVVDKDLTAPPGSPATGAAYIVASPATGSWAAHEKQVARYNGSGWDFVAATEGSAYYVDDEDAHYLYNGTAWVLAGKAYADAAVATHGADHANPHAVTAAQVGAPTTGAFTGHTGDTANPHATTAAQVGAPSTAAFTGHTGDTANPHATTAAQVGAPSTAAFTGHTGDTANPHATTKAQVGLGSVTDDAQLKRAAGDFASFAAKATPVGADIVIAEDSAAAGAKKQSTWSQVFAALGLTRGAGDFASFTAKTTPVGADLLLVEDSAAAGAKKKSTLAQLVGAIGVLLTGGTLTGALRQAPSAAQAFSATLAFDASANNTHSLTGPITSDFAVAIQNAQAGDCGSIGLAQNGTGGFKITAITCAGFTVKMTNPTTVNTTEFKAANACSVLTYQCIGSICWVGTAPGKNPAYT